jgi:hypothetical protein
MASSSGTKSRDWYPSIGWRSLPDSSFASTKRPREAISLAVAMFYVVYNFGSDFLKETEFSSPFLCMRANKTKQTVWAVFFCHMVAERKK